MKLTKRILLITSLSTLAVSCLMLILAIFGIKVFDGVPLRVLLSMSTLAVGGGIAISELNVTEKRKVLGFVGLGFLSLSVLLALISFCTPLFQVETYNKVLGVVALFSVLMAIIISLNTKMEKRLMPLQIVTYVAISSVVAILILLVCGVNVFEIDAVSKIFLVLCVVSAGLLLATTVTSAKKHGDEKTTKTTKSFSEVELLKIENKALKEEIESLKAEIENLKK